MPFLPIDNIQLYYESNGPKSAPSIVFVHAGIVDSRMWKDQVSFFSNNYFVVTYDLRGYGNSTCSEIKFSHANDLQKLLRHLNLDKIHLVGCSFACQIIIDFILEYPN